MLTLLVKLSFPLFEQCIDAGTVKPMQDHRSALMCLSSLLTDPTPGLPGAFVANHGVVKRGVRVRDLRMIVDWEGVERLYDLAADPAEQEDIHAKTPHAARLLRDIVGFWWRDERRWNGTACGNPAFPRVAYWQELAREWGR